MFATRTTVCMNILRTILLCCLGWAGLNAQSVTNFTLSLEEMAIPELPGKQSFAWGQHEGQWLIIGGRTEGLHRPQPFATFPLAANNTEILLVEPHRGRFWSAGLESLPEALAEQLQSSNMNYCQRGETLYLVGGYAYAPSKEDHVTVDKLLAVDLPGMAKAVRSGTSLAPHIRSLAHPGMAVTGGQMERIGDTFFLVGGQYFKGTYNPLGPNNADGFVQRYTNAVRTFEIVEGEKWAVENYREMVDTLELHRRDFNLVPQVFPNGSRGFTAFSGVFQYTEDLPWLNVVDINADGYRPVPGFEQLFSHYECARLPIWESGRQRMHTYFFGGMAQYYLDENGDLINDINVPFVKAITRVTRFPNDSLAEYLTGMEMPGFLGAAGDFFPDGRAPWLEGGVLDVDALAEGKQLVGYIYGGIESEDRNIFFTQEGEESWPSSRIFKVYVERKANAGNGE